MLGVPVFWDATESLLESQNSKRMDSAACLMGLGWTASRNRKGRNVGVEKAEARKPLATRYTAAAAAADAVGDAVEDAVAVQ